MFECHDCFSVTELVTMEDLYISEEGEAWQDVLDGFYNADGQVPCQIDGGLKCFGHPIGASGLRMLYEMYNQVLGRAGDRQLNDPTIGMTHNLGGFPHQNVLVHRHRGAPRRLNGSIVFARGRPLRRLFFLYDRHIWFPPARD